MTATPPGPVDLDAEPDFPLHASRVVRGGGDATHQGIEGGRVGVATALPEEL